MLECEYKRAVIYARYSSDKQNEQSIEGQISCIEKYAKDNGYKIIDTYIDRALSGRTDDRPSFLKMIEDSKLKTFQYILVYKLDRFSRNRYDSAIYKNKLKSNGVKVISAMENISDSPEGIILEAMLEGYSEYYSCELSQKVKRGNRESRKKGNFTGGRLNFGYKIQDKKYIIDEKEAEIVKEIFERVANGDYLKDIAKDLNKGDIMPRYCKIWKPHIIARIAKNSKYIGICKFDDEVYTNITPKIVDEDVFEKAQKVLERHNHGTREKTHYLLSGKVFCSHCGGLYNGRTAHSRHTYTYHYYTCGNKDRHTCTASQSIRKEFLEDSIAESILSLYSTDEAIDQLAKTMMEYFNNVSESNEEVKYLKAKMKADNKKIDTLVRTLEIHESQSVINRISELEKEIEETRVKLNSMRREEVGHLDIEECYRFLHSFKESKLDAVLAKEKVLNLLVKSVVIYDEYALVTLYPSGEQKINLKKSKEEIFFSDAVSPRENTGSPDVYAKLENHDSNNEFPTFVIWLKR